MQSRKVLVSSQHILSLAQVLARLPRTPEPHLLIVLKVLLLLVVVVTTIKTLIEAHLPPQRLNLLVMLHLPTLVTLMVCPPTPIPVLAVLFFTPLNHQLPTQPPSPVLIPSPKGNRRSTRRRNRRREPKRPSNPANILTTNPKIQRRRQRRPLGRRPQPPHQIHLGQNRSASDRGVTPGDDAGGSSGSGRDDGRAGRGGDANALDGDLECAVDDDFE
ncbi:hypothetical protein EST38_g10270 [Candolleomyces aberdarensis]|uniref:Uncharacterized protein n=1 Tax=Candolleomyces aberdarensis TaxID=2316362 RepID=A0A4Q2D8I0_9AGAR|nr:hypothetical protein EST38_g10270 [Candolleomyces aberdarensis]